MTTQTMTTPAIAISPVKATVSALRMVQDLGLWLAHAVVAGILIGLGCTAMVVLLATVGA